MSQTVSIVLLTRNGGATLPALFDAVRSQRIDLPVEIVAVDSGSTDGSIDLIERSVETLIRIPPETFGHGKTRNLAIQRSHGDLVVLLVQDAIPDGVEWLARLIAPLRNDATVAGAFCRQRPRDDATSLTRLYLDRWAATSVHPKSVRLDRPEEFARLDPSAQLAMCTFDNVCSCISRAVWQEHQFADTRIAEDVEWARSVLLAGHRLAYVPEAVVLHSHERSPWYEFSRTYLLHRRLFELFQLQTIPTLPALARATAGSVRLHWHTARHSAEGQRVGLGRALGLAFAWPAGQYLGALSAVKRWTPIPFANV